MTAALVDLSLTPTPRVPRRFLEDDAKLILVELLSRITRQRRRNRELSEWYAGKMLVRSLGIAVSPEFNALETVVGWPSTVIDKLIKRRTIDHIEVPSSAELTDRINRIWVENDLDLESRMLHTGKAIHGIHFNVIANNDGQTVVLPTPASQMTCDYDRVRRRTTAAASIDSPVRVSDPKQNTLYLPDRTVVVEEYGGRFLIVDEYANPSGVVPVERFVNRPRYDKPWGSSNITPAVLSLTKAAVRTLQSMEVLREFFAMPALFALNIAEDAFVDENGNRQSAWETYAGRFKALTGPVDENGEPSKLQPDIKQLPASPPTPLIDMMKMYSQLLSTEVGMPPSMFGFVTDNPPSGDGQRMFESDLVLTAESDNLTDGVGWARSMRKALLADGVPADQLPADIKVVWKSPATFMPAATTDAVTKQVAAQIIPADSDVALEALGYDRATVLRVQQDRRRSQARQLVSQLSNQEAPNADSGAAAGVLAG